MKLREKVEFRTPQHPSLGSNNWGGASPLLARDIPKESLELSYLKLTTIRTRDEIFPDDDAYDLNDVSKIQSQRGEDVSKRSWSRRGILAKIMLVRNEKVTTVLGSDSKKKRWFPRWDPKNRWPQGWC